MITNEMKEKPQVTFDDLDALYNKINILADRIEKQGIIMPKPEPEVEMDENLQVPPEAIEILREVLAYGADKGNDNWWEDAVGSHLRHAIEHINDCLNYPETEGAIPSYKINHAFCYLMFAAVIQHQVERI